MFDFSWNCLKSDCLTSLGDFEWLLIFFFFFVNTLRTEKNEKLELEIPIIPQTLNINN